MQYLFYNTCYRKLVKSEQVYKRLITRKEALFNSTQPRAKVYNRDKVQISKSENAIEHYIIKLDESRLNERINEALSLVNERKHLLRYIERDLQDSKDIYDKAYYYRYVRKQKAEWIAKITGYSYTQIKRILRTVKQELAGEG